MTCMLHSFAVNDPNTAAANTPTATKRPRRGSAGMPDALCSVTTCTGPVDPKPLLWD